MSRWKFLFVLVLVAVTTLPVLALAPPPTWEVETNTEWDCMSGMCKWVTTYTISNIVMHQGEPGEVQNLYFTEFDEDGQITNQELWAQVTTPLGADGSCSPPSTDYCGGGVGEAESQCNASGGSPGCYRTEFCFHNGILDNVTLYGYCSTGCLAPDPFPGPMDPWCPCGNRVCTCMYYITCEQYMNERYPWEPRIRDFRQRWASISNCPNGAVRADSSCDFDEDNELDTGETPRCGVDSGGSCSIDFGE